MLMAVQELADGAFREAESPSWGQNRGSDPLLITFKIESFLNDNSSDALPRKPKRVVASMASD